MRSADLPLEEFDTDKIPHHYLETYDRFIGGLWNQDITLLELGIYKGGSLQLWSNYFPRGNIIGIDLELPEGFTPGDRIRIYQGNQADTAFLTRVASETAPDGFDIIIDDASHIGELTKVAFWHLFTHHLKPGGLYVIEDWGTGYWNDWPDGKSLDLDAYKQPRAVPGIIERIKSRIARSHDINMSKPAMGGHNYGMVGFVKQLVDEQGAADVSRRNMANLPTRASMFESMTITPSMVFITKSRSGV